MTVLINSAIGPSWQQARRARGWSQQHAAHVMGVSVYTLQSIEQGRRRPSSDIMQRAMHALGVPSDTPPPGGGETSGLTVGELEALLASSWALFYAGEGNAAAGTVRAGLRVAALTDGDAARTTLGRLHQLAGVIARDSKQLGDATTHGAAAVQIARQNGSPDQLASALFRLGRTYQQRMDHPTALTLLREAHALAPRCRQPLAGWLKLARVEAESKAAGKAGVMPLVEMRRLLDQVQQELANRPGTDDSFTAVTLSGLWHIEVLALLAQPSQQAAHDAQRLIVQALRRLEPNQHRWRAGMLATQVLAFALAGEADMAADAAQDVLRITRATSHLGYLRRGLAALAQHDQAGHNPHVARLRTMLASV